jgi:uncharacterized membrane protein YdjX (TVP38/TMEM64 family)
LALRLTALALVVALGIATWSSGLLELAWEPERVRELLVESGVWGPLAFLAAFALLEPFGVPGTVFVLPAALVWPAGLALALSWIGALLASVIGFGFARWMGREWVQARLPQSLRVYDERLAERGLQTVIAIRLTFFMLPATHWALGLSRVRFAPYVAGSAIGYLPRLIVIVLFGKGVSAIFTSQSPLVWLSTAIVVAAVFVLLRRRRHSRLRRCL